MDRGLEHLICDLKLRKYESDNFRGRDIRGFDLLSSPT